MLSIRHKSRSLASPTRFLRALLAVLAIAMTAPAAVLAEPEAPVEPPQLVFEPGSYDFGLQPLNWGSQQTTFQLRNVGSDPLQVGSPEITGPGSGAFWTGSSSCYGSTLQPGESCPAQIYFGPYDDAEFTAQFRVNVGSYSFGADLSGVGGLAVFAPASNPVDFGTAAVGSPGTTREIQISNVGNMAGGVFIAVISGGAVGSFQLLDENCTGFELAPAATCTVQVRFRPLSEGVKKATLSLFGESDGGAQVILTGVGSAPVPALAAPPASSVSATPAATPRRRARPHKGSGPRRYRHRRTAIHSAHRLLSGKAKAGRHG